MPNIPTGEFSVTHPLRDEKAVFYTFGLPLPNFVPKRYKARNVASWSGHLTFASELIQALRPEIIVELGTHWGEAYFTFCQTVEEHKVGSLCYAVDHWLGDEHAGHYGEEVFQSVRTHNERFYRQFSYLLRMSFDEALTQFADNSIGLLHIDGFHTYEAASHDFHTWLPKVKDGGIVLLHDICPKHEQFGVWRLWDEIKTEFPNTFEFHHGWGLGVVQKGRGDNESPFFESLFAGSAPLAEEIRRRYIIYASHLENLLKPTEGNEKDFHTEISVQVFPYGSEGYSEKTSLHRQIRAGIWDTLEIELPRGVGEGPLRVDPSCESSLIQIRAMSLSAHPTGELLWNIAEHRDALRAGGTATLLPWDDGLLVSSLGDDPQLILDIPDTANRPVKLTMQLRVLPAPFPVPEAIGGLLTGVSDAAKQEHSRIVEQLHRSDQEKEAAKTERAASEEALRRAGEQLRSTEERLRTAEQRLRAIEAELQKEQNVRQAIEHSLSWRVTAPIRRMMERLRSEPRR